MPNFYPGQTDYIARLNELASVSDVETIAANAAIAAASAETATTQAGIASTAAGVATTQAGIATTAAGTATTAASSASSSATLASEWATKLVDPVSGGEYSAKYWANYAATVVTGQLIYKGSWDASSGVYPTSPTPATGHYYKISVGGIISGTDYSPGDSIIYNGSGWDKIDSTEDPTILRTANIGSSVQAYDPDLTTWAGVTPAAGITTFLTTPTSANLASALTDETGSGKLLFNDSPAVKGTWTVESGTWTLPAFTLGGAVTGGGQNVSGLGLTSISDTTDATSTTSASLKTAGGLGVAKNLYIGGSAVFVGADVSVGTNGIVKSTSGYLITRADTDLYLDARQGGVSGSVKLRTSGTTIAEASTGVFSVAATTDSSSTTTGALTVAGGLGVAKKAYFGDAVTVSGAVQPLTIITSEVGTTHNSNIIGHFRSNASGRNASITLGDNANARVYLSYLSGGFSLSTNNIERLNIPLTGGFSIKTSASVTDTTDSSSTTTGALTVAGGLGVAKKAYHGDNIVMASGKGIDFSATSDGSGTTTSEVLSDYEEGTFTPSITFATPGDLSVVYGTRVGRYTKIGNRVFISIYLDTSTFTHTTASSYLNITGLPFTVQNASNNNGMMSARFQGVTLAGYTQFEASAVYGSTYMFLTASGSGQNTTSVQASAMPTGGTIVLNITGSYEV